MKKSDFPVISTLLFLITAVVTVFLFYYLTAEKSRTSIFILNWAYACFLEFLFFGYIALVKFSKIHSSAIYSIVGTVVIFYIIIAALLVLSYNLILNQFFSYRFYISAILIGTTLTIIIYGFLVKLDIHNKENTETDKAKRVILQSVMENFQLLQGRFERIAKSKNILEKNQSGFTNSMEKLTAIIRYIPPSAIENINLLSIIQNYEQDLKQTISQLETAEVGMEKDLKNKLDNIVSDAISNIEAAKKTLLN